MNHFAVNLGANDGATSDPVASLYHGGGWAGLAVELEPSFCGRLTANLGGTNASIACPVGVTPGNAAALLAEAQAPRDLDYLKVDIDSYDCDVLASLLGAGYAPKVVQMEVGTLPPPVRFASHWHRGYTRPHAQTLQAFGCSLSYAHDLLQAFGGKKWKYELVEASLDAVWVRSDVLSRAEVGYQKALDRARPKRAISPISTGPAHPSPASAEAFKAAKQRLGPPPPKAYADPLHAYVNGFWRWPWRRELHIWEVGTEHWFLLRHDAHRLAALQDHMRCVDACFHSPRHSGSDGWIGGTGPFHYTLHLEKALGPFRGDLSRAGAAGPNRR